MCQQDERRQPKNMPVELFCFDWASIFGCANSGHDLLQGFSVAQIQAERSLREQGQLHPLRHPFESVYPVHTGMKWRSSSHRVQGLP